MRWCVLGALAALLAGSGDAAAEWTIKSYTDRMSDQTVRYAKVAAKQPSHGITASILLFCAKDRDLGGYKLQISISARIAAREVKVRYRFDSRRVRRRSLPVDRDLQTIHIVSYDANDFLRARNAKRLRLEILPIGGPELFYEFDISGMDEVLRAMPCKRGALMPKE